MQKRKQQYRYISFILVLVLVAGCKVTDKTYTAADYSLPADYAGKRDTGTMAKMSWDKFFADKDLVALMSNALKQNPDLMMALQKVEVARAGLLMNKGALMPSLEAGAAASGNRYGRYTMNGAGNITTPEIPYPLVPDYNLGLSSSWEVDIWGKLRNRKKAAQLRLLSSEMGKNAVVTSLLSEVAYRYYELVSLDDELEILEENRKLQETALEIVTIQKDGGRATELAVKQFAAQLMQTKSMEYKARQEIARVEYELNFLSGVLPQKISRTNSIFNGEMPRSIAGGVPSDLLHNRPDVMQAELELRATKADVAAARAAFLPSFNIAATAGFNAYNPGMLFHPLSLAYGILGGATAPLFNRHLIRASYNLSMAEHKASYYQYGKTALNAVYEVLTSMNNIENLRLQYELNEKEATTLSEAVAISKDLYVTGYANYLEVITAQKNALEAQLNVIQTRKNVYFAFINLYRALGGGWQ